MINNNNSLKFIPLVERNKRVVKSLCNLAFVITIQQRFKSNKCNEKVYLVESPSILWV